MIHTTSSFLQSFHHALMNDGTSSSASFFPPAATSHWIIKQSDMQCNFVSCKNKRYEQQKKTNELALLWFRWWTDTKEFAGCCCWKLKANKHLLGGANFGGISDSFCAARRAIKLGAKRYKTFHKIFLFTTVIARPKTFW